MVQKIDKAIPSILKIDNNCFFITLSFDNFSLANDENVAHAINMDNEEFQSVLIKKYNAKLDTNNQHFFNCKQDAKEALIWLESLWIAMKLQGNYKDNAKNES